MNKIKEEQLKKIKEQNQKLNDLVLEIGVLETKKHGLLHAVAETNVEIDKFKIDLEKEYGSININLEDGSYTEIEDKEEETPVAAV